MALFDPRGTADAMADLLDRERGAILSGQFDVLERLIPEKERLSAKLVLDKVDRAVAERLQGKAQHNSRLLEAMRVGLRDAGRKLNAIRRAPADLHTYDASGRRTALGTSPRLKETR